MKLNKGESVVTCLTCYQTLTHQWIENERMKVPLEMRKYNWMAVPPPPPPPITTAIKNESINEPNSKVYDLQFLIIDFYNDEFPICFVAETNTFRSNDYSDSSANHFTFISN